MDRIMDLWEKSGIWHDKTFRLLLFLEALLLLLGMAGLFRGDRIVADESTMEITLGGGEYLEGRQGYYIDGSYGYDGVFLTARPGKLRPGVYSLRILFEADENVEAAFGIESESGIFRNLLSNFVTIYGGAGEQTGQFYVCGTDDRAKITVEYSGEASFLVSGLELVHTNAGSRIFICLILCVGVLVNTLMMLYCYGKRHPVSSEKKLVWSGIPGLAILASVPIFVDYMIVGTDAFFHWTRIEALAQSIVQGAVPARVEAMWLYGHGYANSVFYCDTFLVFPALLRLIGFDMNIAYNTFVFAVNLATALIAYLCFKGCFRDRRIGMFGSVLYTLAPFRICNIYHRAAVGEYTAAVFFPVLVYGFYRIFTDDPNGKGYRRNWLVLTLGYSGLIQSHVLFCAAAGGLSVILCLILIKKVFRRQIFMELVKTAGGTILLNFWFLVPFLDIFDTVQAAGSSSNVDIRGLLDTVSVLCITFAACAGAARLLKSGDRFWKNTYVAILCGTAVVCSLYQTNDILMKGEAMIRLYTAEHMGHSSIMQGEFLPEGAERNFSFHGAVPSEGVDVVSFEKENLDTVTQVNVASGGGEHWLELPMLAYKGYRAQDMDTGEIFEVQAGTNREVRVPLPEGYSGKLHVWYAGMWYWRAAEAVSLAFAAGLLYDYLQNRRRGGQRG